MSAAPTSRSGWWRTVLVMLWRVSQTPLPWSAFVPTLALPWITRRRTARSAVFFLESTPGVVRNVPSATY